MSRRHRRSQLDFHEVTSAGWVAFVVGLMIASFFGGAVRVLLSDRQVDHWIQNALKTYQPPFELTYNSVHLRLAEGILPKFGLEITDLKLHPGSDPCRFPAVVAVDHAFLPVSPSLLWGGRLRFRNVKLEGVSYVPAEACKATLEASKNPEVPHNDSKYPSVPVAILTPEDRFAPIKDYFRHQWGEQLARTSDWLDGLEIDRLNLSGLPEPVANMVVDRATLRLGAAGSSASVELRAHLGGIWEENLGRETIKVKLDVTPRAMAFNAEQPVREGALRINAVLDLVDFVHRGRIELGFIAANQAVEILRNWRVVTDPVDLKRSWLSGHVEWTGLLGEPVLTEVKISDLAFSGEIGEMKVEGLRLRPRPGVWEFVPFVIDLRKLSVHSLLNSLGRQGYTGVISDFGSVSGQFKVDSPQEMSFSGELTGLELAFSRRSVRARQRFDRIAGELALSHNRVSGIVNDFALQSGVAKGLASFNLDRSLLNGVFQVKVDEFQFQPEVQNLMVGGVIAPLSLYGQGRLQAGEVQSWSGEFGTSRIDSKDWTVTGIKAHSEFAGQQMALKLKAEGVELMPGNYLGEKLRPVIKSVLDEQSPIRFQHLGVRLDVEAKGGRWRNGVAALVGNKVVAATLGTWDEQGLNGEMSVDLPGAKMQRWRIFGPVTELEIQ